VKYRLKKLAEIEQFEDQSMEMTPTIVNQVLVNNGEDYVVSDVLYRNMIHDNDKYIVEMWDLGDDKVGVFSGKYPSGAWTPSNIEFHGVFDNLQLAIQHAQQSLQNNADTPGAITAIKKSRLKKISNVKEKQYKDLAKSFVKKKDLK
jgi:hypothetical protein